jgi:hypothetical protein
MAVLPRKIAQQDPFGLTFFHDFGLGTPATEDGSQELTAVPSQERALYVSEGGDGWSLVRDQEVGRIFVRHTPNLASGGQTSDIEVGAFLVRGGMGPKKQELLRLIGSIVEGSEVNG